MRLRTWGATDTGQKRKNNQDDFLIDPHLGLAIVADGVGGQSRGEVASTLAARTVREYITRSDDRLSAFIAAPSTRTRDAVTHGLREAVQMASAQVFRAAETLAPGRGMSCTLDALLVLGNTGFLAHVGDSRTYLVRRGGCYQLTEDHSVIAEKVRKGILTPEQARTAKGRNVITRAVGTMPSVKVDTLVMQLYEGDGLLLCSDGLSRYVRQDEIPGMMQPYNARTPERMVAVANDRGGKDNITVVTVQIEANGGHAYPTTAAQLALLRGFPLLETTTYRELAMLGSVLDQAQAKAGHLLFREGDRGDEMYFLVEGEAVITRSGAHLSTVSAGDTFGEMTLLDVPTRSASALITRPSKLLILRRHRFDQLVREHPELATRLLMKMLQRLSAVVRRQNALMATDRAKTS
jgi:serine/threonine protein phosphatase PrpC